MTKAHNIITKNKTEMIKMKAIYTTKITAPKYDDPIIDLHSKDLYIYCVRKIFYFYIL